MTKIFTIISILVVMATVAFSAKKAVCECAACTCAPICPCAIAEPAEMPIVETNI